MRSLASSRASMVIVRRVAQRLFKMMPSVMMELRCLSRR